MPKSIKLQEAPPERWVVPIRLFAAEVDARGRRIDAAGSIDWHSLTVGWALRYGMKPAEAYNFATFIRYETNLG